jgi:hypothetical protein
VKFVKIYGGRSLEKKRAEVTLPSNPFSGGTEKKQETLKKL